VRNVPVIGLPAFPRPHAPGEEAGVAALVATLTEYLGRCRRCAGSLLVQAALPLARGLPRPAWARLDIRFGRTLPVATFSRWSGPVLHAVAFLE
jgi:hypothetical protein